MRNIQKSIYLAGIVIILTFSQCATKSNITAAHISEAKGMKGENLVVYALPRTKLQVFVETTHVIKRAGPFAAFAKQYLDIATVIEKNEEEWFVSGIKIEPVQEADPTQYYILDGGKDVAPGLLKLGREGVVVPFPCTKDVENIRELDTSCPKIYNAMDGTGMDTTFSTIPIPEKQVKQKTMEGKASEAANFIYRLRKRRFKLLASMDGQQANDGEALKISIQELDKLEEGLVSLFIGKRVMEKRMAWYEFLPDENNEQKPNVLFRFSKSREGILPDTDMSGQPVYIQLTKTGNIKPVQQFFYQQEQSFGKKGGILYRIPEETEIRIYDNEKELAKQTAFISQYGVVTALPVGFLGE